MATKNWDGWDKMEIAPTWDFENDHEIRGVFVSVEENVGPNGSKMYTLEKANGEKIGVWGNAVLDTRMKNITAGEEVGIEYLGKEESQKVKGRSYHNFEVYHRKAPFVKVESDGEFTEKDEEELDRTLAGK